MRYSRIIREERLGMNNRAMTKTEKKLIDYIGKKLAVVVNSRFETEAEIRELERLGNAAGRLADWLEEEQVDADLDEVKCAMICEALADSLQDNKIL